MENDFKKICLITADNSLLNRLQTLAESHHLKLLQAKDFFEAAPLLISDKIEGILVDDADAKLKVMLEEQDKDIYSWSQELFGNKRSVIKLPTTVNSEEIDKFLGLVHNALTIFEKLPKALIDEYLKLVPGKLDEMATNLEKLKKGSDPDALAALRFLSHKMAGSSGTYGFVQVSQDSRQMERLVLEMIDVKEGSPLEGKQLEKLEKLYKAIKKGFLDER